MEAEHTDVAQVPDSRIGERPAQRSQWCEKGHYVVYWIKQVRTYVERAPVRSTLSGYPFVSSV